MKIYIKNLVSIILALSIISGFAVFASAEENSDNSIRFGSDGKLKIMHITDTHLEAGDMLDNTIWVIGEACDKEQPDIVMITGDNVQNYDDPADTKKLIDALMNVFESRDIPVAVTFGNHDSEAGAMSREELMAYYNTFSCSVSVDDGEALSGCGTYNIPVMSSDGEKVKFNLWVFDSGDYDENGNYGCVLPDQIEWYKETSDKLAENNGGERVNSLVFQHIIVPEVYDALKMTTTPQLFAFPHIYNEDEYYMFDPENTNYGTLNEKPCCGYLNYGQFDAMVEKGDVLAMFTGHDHTNAFGVKHKGIDIVNSLSTRYLGDAFSTQYGYRIIEVNESNTSVYETIVVSLYDFIDFGYAINEWKNDNFNSSRLAFEIAINGTFQKIITAVYHTFARLVTFREITYAD